MAYLPIGNNRYTEVDDDLYEELSQYTWCTNSHGYVWRATRDEEKPYVQASHILLHRVILGLTDPNVLGDHRDGNKLNNLRSNLREATKSTNAMNRVVQKNSTTGYKGVSYRKDRGKYSAYINKDGKRIRLGVYNTPEEAAKAYNDKAVELHGEFAVLNTIRK